LARLVERSAVGAVQDPAHERIHPAVPARPALGLAAAVGSDQDLHPV
jgi:hypothetical protein